MGTKANRFYGIFLTLAFVALDAVGMTAELTRVVTWRRGESIAGEEFIAANEGIVDYLATLEHPTEILKSIRYQCMVKSRLIRPSVVQTGSGSSTTSAWVEVRMVYELRDCVKE